MGRAERNRDRLHDIKDAMDRLDRERSYVLARRDARHSLDTPPDEAWWEDTLRYNRLTIEMQLLRKEAIHGTPRWVRVLSSPIVVATYMRRAVVWAFRKH